MACRITFCYWCGFFIFGRACIQGMCTERKRFDAAERVQDKGDGVAYLTSRGLVLRERVQKGSGLMQLRECKTTVMVWPLYLREALYSWSGYRKRVV